MSAEESRESQGSGLNSPSPAAGSEPSKNEVRCVVRLLDGDILHFDVQVRP